MPGTRTGFVCRRRPVQRCPRSRTAASGSVASMPRKAADAAIGATKQALISRVPRRPRTPPV